MWFLSTMSAGSSFILLGSAGFSYFKILAIYIWQGKQISFPLFNEK